MQDCSSIISKFVHKGDWKSFIFTCKDFYSVNSKKEVIKRRHLIFTLIKSDLSPFLKLNKLYQVDRLKNIYKFKINKNNVKNIKLKMDYIIYRNYLFIYSNLPRSQIVNIINPYLSSEIDEWDTLSNYEKDYKREIKFVKELETNTDFLNSNDKLKMFKKLTHTVSQNYRYGWSRDMVVNFCIISEIIDHSFLVYTDELNLTKIGIMIRGNKFNELASNPSLTLDLIKKYDPNFMSSPFWIRVLRHAKFIKYLSEKELSENLYLLDIETSIKLNMNISPEFIDTHREISEKMRNMYIGRHTWYAPRLKTVHNYFDKLPSLDAIELFISTYMNENMVRTENIRQNIKYYHF